MAGGVVVNMRLKNNLGNDPAARMDTQGSRGHGDRVRKDEKIGHTGSGRCRGLLSHHQDA